MRTCYLAALSSLKNSPASRAFYDRKRREGKPHKQALIALARRLINTLWAMLRDDTRYQEPTPAGAARRFTGCWTERSAGLRPWFGRPVSSVSPPRE